jgi:hypothetical protein
MTSSPLNNEEPESEEENEGNEDGDGLHIRSPTSIRTTSNGLFSLVRILSGPTGVTSGSTSESDEESDDASDAMEVEDLPPLIPLDQTDMNGNDLLTESSSFSLMPPSPPLTEGDSKRLRASEDKT